MKHEDAGDGVLALVAQWDRFGICNDQLDPRPSPQVSLRLPQVGVRQVQPDGREPGPGLLEGIEKPSRPTTDVEQSEAALISSGEYFVQLRQGLASDGIRRTFEQNLDLGVVAPRRSVGHPATGLEMKILQVVSRSS